MTPISDEVREKRRSASTPQRLKVRAEYQQSSPDDPDEPADNCCDDG